MRTSRRITTVVLALAGACAFAFAGVGVPWWSTTEISIGPNYTARCFGGECERVTLDWVNAPSWTRFGVATWAAGLIAAVCVVALAGAVASRRTGRLAAKMSITAAMAATAAGAAFVATFPRGGMTRGMGVDFGGYLYFAGVLFAVAAAVVALRSTRAVAA